MDRVLELLQQAGIGEIKEKVSFKTLTTFKIGGIASYVLFPKNIECLIKTIRILKENNCLFKIFGNGSNIIPSDNNYNGFIIKLSNLNKMENNNGIIKVEAGYSLMRLANEMSNSGYSGLEWACGIPGTVGGAVYMNAGAYKSSISDILQSALVLDNNLELQIMSNSSFDFSYRYSNLMETNYICISIVLKLNPKNSSDIINTINDRRARRMASQPLEYPSAGSVFRNPDNEYAGHLIEECNLKGYQIGDAEISQKHANFIVNKGNANANDVKSLIDLAKEKVKKKFNIELKQEQELFNWE